MILQTVKTSLVTKKLKTYQLSTMAGVCYSALSAFLNGKPHISTKSLQKIFRVLGINVVNADGSFLAYGYDLRTAVERGMKIQGISKHRLAKTVGCSAPSVGYFISGKTTPKVSVVEKMLSVLSLRVKEISAPSNIPPIEVKPKPSTADFPLGQVVKAAMAAREISMYRFAKDNGLTIGNLITFINHGKSLGCQKVERIFCKLNIDITDGGNYYDGSDFRSAIKQTIDRQKITVTAVARKIGMNESALRCYLNGRCNMSVLRIVRVLTELGLRCVQIGIPW